MAESLSKFKKKRKKKRSTDTQNMNEVGNNHEYIGNFKDF